MSDHIGDPAMSLEEALDEIEELREQKMDNIDTDYGCAGSVVTWSFYVDDPDGEHRLRECLDAPNVLRAVREYERWLSETIDLGWNENLLKTARDKLFEIFNEENVTVPGWE